jgi:hypothetical protein
MSLNGLYPSAIPIFEENEYNCKIQQYTNNNLIILPLLAIIKAYVSYAITGFSRTNTF